jgi:hypothetical protein
LRGYLDIGIAVPKEMIALHLPLNMEIPPLVNMCPLPDAWLPH